MAGRWLGYKKLGCTAGHRRIVLRTRRASEPFSHIVQLFCLSGIYVKDALCRFGKEIQTIKCKLDNNINSAMHLFQIVV